MNFSVASVMVSHHDTHIFAIVNLKKQVVFHGRFVACFAEQFCSLSNFSKSLCGEFPDFSNAEELHRTEPYLDSN